MTAASYCRAGTTIGFWLGFPHQLTIRREGIARFTLSLAEHLLKNCPVCLEFWCYRVNETAFRALLAPLLDAPAYAGRVGFFTEGSYGSLLKFGPKGPQRDPYAGRYAPPRLEEVVNRLSGADCFLIPIVTLANALYINKPKLVALHDLAPLVYSDLFSSDHPMYEGGERLATERLVRGFIRQNAFFSSNSDYIRREHLLRLFPEVDEKDTSYVHLPVVLPQNIESQLIPRADLTRHLGIAGPYLFYPTQVRPYKNVLTLLKTLDRLGAAGHDLRLVLTGRLADSRAALEYVRSNERLDGRVIETGDVSERVLFSLHRHATATVVPTLCEGGFPWQALEAMAMDTPVVTSRIVVVEERLRSVGLAPETCGLLLFDPLDVDGLCRMIEQAGRLREGVVAAQRRVLDRIAAHSWDDAAREYFAIMTQRVGRPRRVKTLAWARCRQQLSRLARATPVLGTFLQKAMILRRLLMRIDEIYANQATFAEMNRCLRRIEKALGSQGHGVRGDEPFTRSPGFQLENAEQAPAPDATCVEMERLAAFRPRLGEHDSDKR